MKVSSGELTEILSKLASLLGELLMLPWLMNSKFAKFRQLKECLHAAINKYWKFLETQSDRSNNRLSSEELIRCLQDQWKFETIEGTVKCYFTAFYFKTPGL